MVKRMVVIIFLAAAIVVKTIADEFLVLDHENIALMAQMKARTVHKLHSQVKISARQRHKIESEKTDISVNIFAPP